jgi:hypothetical protein
MGERAFQIWANGPAALLAALVASAAGCGPPSTIVEPQPGVLTVVLTPSLPATFTNVHGNLGLESLTVLGDVAPDARATKQVSGNLENPITLTYLGLPQGFYSGVRGELEHPSLEAIYKGLELHMDLQVDDLHLDLRSEGAEVALGHSARFTLAVDVGAWFAQDLDGAQVSDGSIVIDASHNTDLALKIAQRLRGSFSLMTQPLLQ